MRRVQFHCHLVFALWNHRRFDGGGSAVHHLLLRDDGYRAASAVQARADGVWVHDHGGGGGGGPDVDLLHDCEQGVHRHHGVRGDGGEQFPGQRERGSVADQ